VPSGRFFTFQDGDPAFWSRGAVVMLV
jgi:hypothetical protein